MELRPRWISERLFVKQPPGTSTTTAIERVSSLLTIPWTFRKLNTSRFLCRGDGCRFLLQSEFLGLRKLMSLARSSPISSGYWLHHYDNMKCPYLQRFVLVAALGRNLAMP